MTEITLTLEQELEDFIQVKLDEWLIENPEPEYIPEERPEVPESKFLSLVAGFTVLEVHNPTTVRLHVSQTGQSARYIDLPMKQLKEFIEQLLILEADMQGFNSWNSQFGNAEKQIHEWRSLRGQFVSDCRRQFVRMRENIES